MKALWVALLCACHGPEEPGRPADSGAAEAPALAGCTPSAGEDQAVELGQPLDLTAALVDGEAAAWTWDLGDGTVLDGQSVSHAWSEPGVYTAVVQCTAPDGSRSADATRITAHPPPTERRARWSSTLAVSDDGGELYVINPEAGTLAVIEASTGAVEELPACDEPVSVSAAGSRVAVSCQGGGGVAWWDRATGDSGMLSLPWPSSSPEGVAAAEPDGSAWWVAVRDRGALARLELAGPVLILEVGPEPFGVAVDHRGYVLATRWRSPETGGQIYRLEGSETTWAASSISLPLDTSGDSDTTTGGVPNLLEQVVPSPGGEALYVPFAHANVLRGAWLSGQDLVHDATVRAIVATIDATTGAESSLRKQLDERGRANALVPSPLGERLYVLHTGTRSVTVLDTWTGDLAGSILDVGHAPTGIAVSPDGDTLYVYAWLDRQVRAYDVTDLSRLIEPTWVAETVAEEPLSDAVLLGKQIFWDAQDPRITRSGYISCANCHPHGDHDGQTWDFTDRGEGLRNTPSLLGRAGMGMGPVHWSANFDEIQDFENDMRGPFGGAGFLSEEDWAEAGETLGPAKAGRSADLDALAAYVSTLNRARPSPHLTPPGGSALFEAAGCAECHPYPLYTDSSLASFLRHDVGTLTDGSGERLGAGPLDGLDTPTLLGAWDGAPYLHDGSAPTIEAAIAAHEGYADHPELTRLAEFVRSL